MTHDYRTLQHWNRWLAQQELGGTLLETEKQILTTLLNKHFGKQALLIGVSNQTSLLEASVLPCHATLSPMPERKHVSHIESDLHELPLLTGSIDLVMLPHTLEFVDNPRQLLAEACRIVKPEGLIAICGFNPYSTWGMKKKLTASKKMPWFGNFIHAYKIRHWLELADFSMEKQQFLLFRPFLNNASLFHKLYFMEKIGNLLFPSLGNAYILLARAKVIPLTPIRMKWKQRLSNIRISTTTGYIAR